MKTHDTIEQEINQIRLQIYEKSSKKYGFKIISSANENVSHNNRT